MPRRRRPVIGVDYIIDADGRAQFTREYLLKQGYCCEHACRYCPYGHASHPDPADDEEAHAVAAEPEEASRF